MKTLDVTGRTKLSEGLKKYQSKVCGQNTQTISKTVKMETVRGHWNFGCRSELSRDKKQHQWRRRVTGTVLTLRRESVGSKRD